MSLVCVAFSGVASAKGHHHKGTGKGTPSAPTITVQVSPNPLIETYQSDVVAIVQVETSPAYAGDPVVLEAPQFFSGCGSGYLSDFTASAENLTLQLDNEGNATADLVGYDCAPGTDLVEASLSVVPFLTATTEFAVQPPTVTTPGVYGYPTSSGTVTGGEVETGDSGILASGVLAVFYVETDPVYAEQPVEISSPQLAARCPVDSGFDSFFATGKASTTSILDDDGNAIFLFFGISCAAGTSVVTADVEAGTNPTYTTTFTILPPQVTI